MTIVKLEIGNTEKETYIKKQIKTTKIPYLN